MYGYIIFTDLEKYSALKDADLKIYFDKIIPVIYQKLKVYKDSAIVWNTWGDAIVAAYENGEKAINMALAYRDLLNNLDFNEFGIRKLNPRIAGHFGEFEILFDQVSGKMNIHGTNVNLAARIEPVTLPNEIFISNDFKEMACKGFDTVEGVKFDDMGIVKLAKNSGEMHLYRLRRQTEAPIPAVGKLKSSTVTSFGEEIKPTFINKNRSGFKKSSFD
jgi:hypothetical protein